MLNQLTALYSDLDIEYNQVMSGPYEDLSVRNDKCEVIAGLKDGRISGFWRPMVAVGEDKELKLQIERLYDTCQNIYYMDFLIDGRLSVVSQFLLRHGHTARPYYTQVINISGVCFRNEQDIKAYMRKSYKSLVTKTAGIVCSGSVKRFKEVHKEVKGITRPDSTWEIQELMNPVCCTQGEVGAMFYQRGDWGYYASGAGDNTHACIWWAIMHFKRCGYKYVEMGEQLFSDNEKLVNISKFKRGFGGTTQTRLILEKENK